ncbi:hypothetical protein NH8B_3167 [Pseudogulbenkiania sp. NH8B]|nr:hypothetical protein NH8B_3167 [Pseudogulbenkiania sp. NH8B]
MRDLFGKAWPQRMRRPVLGQAQAGRRFLHLVHGTVPIAPCLRYGVPRVTWEGRGNTPVS